MRGGKKLASFELEAIEARRTPIPAFSSVRPNCVVPTRGERRDNASALSNGINTVLYDPASSYNTAPGVPSIPRMVFTGQMDYRPNVEAVTDFAPKLLPAIRGARSRQQFAHRWTATDRRCVSPVRVTRREPSLVPSMTCALVGGQPTLSSRRYALHGVFRTRCLEAMAMARPVVASTAAAEGIEAQPKACILRCGQSGGRRMKPRCQSIASDVEPRSKTGAPARAHVMAHYGWQAALDQLEAALDRTSKRRPKQAA